MARLTGVVARSNAPAQGAYVQLRNLGGDFQAEIRTGEDGKYTFHPVPGQWRLVWFAPQTAITERVVEVAEDDDDMVVDLTLEE